MLDFHNQRTSIARKSHTCSLCGQEITVGEKYERWAGKWCGDFYNHCFHLTCCDLVEEYAITFGEEEWSTDCIHDWLCDECCRNCSEVDSCELDLFHCDMVLNRILRRSDNHAS